MTRENALQILRSVAEESLLKYRAQIRGIFGSVARGEETPGSDIDVLVEFEENADLFDFVGLSILREDSETSGTLILSVHKYSRRATSRMS